MKTPFVEGQYADDIGSVAAAIKSDDFDFGPRSCSMLSNPVFFHALFIQEWQSKHHSFSLQLAMILLADRLATVIYYFL